MLINENLKISDIEVKSFLPFAYKHLLCKKVIDVSILTDENNIVSCDFFMEKLAKDLNILSFYTDLEFNENSEEDYDFLVSSGLFNNVLSKIDDSELYFIEDMINKEINQKIKVGNSLSNVVGSKMQKLIDSIPNEKSIKKMMTEAKKQINGIKPENLEILKDALGKSGGLNG